MIKIAQVPVKTFLSKSKIPGVDYVINPYVGCPHKCIYCYAEYMRKFSGHAEAWGDFLDVRQCSVPLKPSKLFHTRVLISSVTDPYNPYEQQYESTRNLLKQLQYCQAYVHILTKSALVVRDIDLLRKMPGSKVTFSFSSADEKFRQRAEPGASRITEKIKALQQLHQNGITTEVMIAPIMPGLTQWKTIVEQTCAYTHNYTFDSLNMRPAYQGKVLAFIRQYYPKLLPLYTDIYVNENTIYWEQLSSEIEIYMTERKLDFSVFFSVNPTKVPNKKPAISGGLF